MSVPTNHSGSYTDEQKALIVADVCEFVATYGADGSMAKACAEPGMPSRLTVRKWISDNPEFAAMFKAAEQERGEVMADSIIGIVDGTDPDPQNKRVRAWAYMWRASKLHPIKLGDKVAVSDPDGKAMNAPIVNVYLPAKD